ncbi:alpha/beta hydrolase-fold protein [Flocculibacter collagenilyticus]|uniref:alpha/beta hydrolase-fold protein n=1 Tax=Flocculibacter collagenilyticus TaxID=2744479 RepID=UPI0018F79831|nr:alpha/beta hydrolase-fold protein [Flocculibacter collagenilyticus]
MKMPQFSLLGSLGIFILSMLSATSLAKTPIVEGYVFEHSSEVLDEQRRYMISLPERYFLENSEQRNYPALYIVDADFQFHHTAATAKHLARVGKLPPMIVVGIANQGNQDYMYATTWSSKKKQETDQKSDDPFGGAEQFHKYLKNELVPLIDKRYRTSKDKALAGYSLGGLFSLYSMMNADTPFNAFIAMSPSAWYDDNELKTKVEQYLQHAKPSSPVFLSVANEEGMGVTEINLAFEKYAPKDLRWKFKQYPEENHFTTSLPALYDGITFLSPTYSKDGSDLVALGDYHAVLDYFEQQKQQWGGFTFGWLQAYQFSKYVFWSKQVDKADEILAAVKKRFPESYVEVTTQLTKGFLAKKNLDKAEQLLRSIQTSAEHFPEWHSQLSKVLAAQGKQELADKHHQKAIKFASKAQLASWEVWELH